MSAERKDIMAKLDTMVVSDILNYVRQVDNGVHANWYVGIAADPEARLFTDHNVSKQKGLWVYVQAINDQHSRSAESILLKKGFDGGSGGGSSQSTFLYAYKKTYTTVE